jgi:hypothetical protein
MTNSDQEDLIEEMRRDSGADSHITFSFRVHKPFGEEISTFCKNNGVKKSVLLRRLLRLGWTELQKSPIEDA